MQVVWTQRIQSEQYLPKWVLSLDICKSKSGLTIGPL